MLVQDILKWKTVDTYVAPYIETAAIWCAKKVIGLKDSESFSEGQFTKVQQCIDIAVFASKVFATFLAISLVVALPFPLLASGLMFATAYINLPADKQEMVKSAADTARVAIIAFGIEAYHITADAIDALKDKAYETVTALRARFA